MKGKTLIGIFLLSQIMDIMSTYVAINWFEFAEANPIAYSLFNNVGMAETMALKLALGLFLIANYIRAKKSEKGVAWSFEKSLQVGGFSTFLAATYNISGILFVI